MVVCFIYTLIIGKHWHNIKHTTTIISRLWYLLSSAWIQCVFFTIYIPYVTNYCEFWLAICLDYQWWTMYVVIISWLKQSHLIFDHHRLENLHIWWNYRTCLWNNVFCVHVIWDCNDDNKNLCVYFVLSVTTLAHRHTHKKKYTHKFLLSSLQSHITWTQNTLFQRHVR
jgi:hypothetical protein